VFFLVCCEVVSFLVVWVLLLGFWIVSNLIDGANWLYFVMWFYSHIFELFIGYLKLIVFYYLWSLSLCLWIMIILILMVGTMCG